MLRRVVQLGIVVAVLCAGSGSVATHAAPPDGCTIPVENVGFVTGSKPMWVTGSKPMWATELPGWESSPADDVVSPQPACTTTPP